MVDLYFIKLIFVNDSFVALHSISSLVLVHCLYTKDTLNCARCADNDMLLCTLVTAGVSLVCTTSESEDIIDILFCKIGIDLTENSPTKVNASNILKFS